MKLLIGTEANIDIRKMKRKYNILQRHKFITKQFLIDKLNFEN